MVGYEGRQKLVRILAVELRYIAIYRLLGLNKLPDDSETMDFVEFDGDDVVVKLTTNPEPFFFHIDRASALSTLLLQGMLGPSREDTPEQRIAKQIESIRDKRRRQNIGGVFLIFEGELKISSPNFSYRRDMEEFSICFDAFEKGIAREKFLPVIQATLTAMAISFPENADTRIQKVRDISFLIEDKTKKPLYCFTAELGTPTVRVSIPLTDDIVKKARAHARAFPTDRKLARVADLLIESKEIGTNDLRAFISAWSALEMFVNSTFKTTYLDLWLHVISSNTPLSAKTYFDRLKDVMSGKHGLRVKFVVIASILNPNSAISDEINFTQVKSVRDDLFHGKEVVGSRYPVEDTLKLLQKYLDLHLTA